GGAQARGARRRHLPGAVLHLPRRGRPRRPAGRRAGGHDHGPPLAGSALVQGRADGVVKVLLHGLIGPVEGRTYQSLMAPMGSNRDEWIAAVASYVRNGFGNSASIVTPAEVAKIRAAAGGRNYPWTAEELDALQPGLLRYRPDW